MNIISLQSHVLLAHSGDDIYPDPFKENNLLANYFWYIHIASMSVVWFALNMIYEL